MKELKVDIDGENMRLDRWLRRQLGSVPQSVIEKGLRQKVILLNGQKATSDIRLAEGNVITIKHALTEERPERDEIERKVVSKKEQQQVRDMVILETPDFFVLNKPSGLAVQGGTKTTKHLDTLLWILDPEAKEVPKLVHRLDKDTSGLIIIARSTRNATWFTKAFQEKRIEKSYLAMVAGRVHQQEGTLNWSLAKKPVHMGERIMVDEENGDIAITHYETIMQGEGYSWLLLMPETGRTHQLRVHLAAFGHPIIGDAKYTDPNRRLAPYLRPDKMHMCLHAYRLRFQGPDGEYYNINCPIPDHMRMYWPKNRDI